MGAAMAATFEFTRQGRTRRTLAIVVSIYAGLAGAVIVIDAAWWLVAALALLTLPALWDLWRNPGAGVRLNDSRLNWHTGRRGGMLNLQEINHMRFDTRWDFSVRVTAVLMGDKQIRLPHEALPPHRTFETELRARHVRVVRHHFTIF